MSRIEEALTLQIRAKRYPILPVPAPRQGIGRSLWNPKHEGPLVRYHAFRDHVRLLHVEVPACCYLRFELPVPKSGQARVGRPHTQTPDLDNLVKALLDAALNRDEHVHVIYAEKVWAREGAIVVGTLEQALRQQGAA